MKAPQTAAIAFDSYVGKTTRADDATLVNLKAITVYGYIGDETPARIFDGTIVSNASGDWTYSPLQYWTAGKNYFFTAVASPSIQGNSEYSYAWAETLAPATEGFYGSGTISMDNSKAGGNEDVVYAYATASTPNEIVSAPSRVKFAFRHAMSRVKFTFKNMMGSEAYSVKIHNLKINNAASNGSLVLGAEKPEWTSAGSTELGFRSSYFVPTTAVAVNSGVVSSGTKFLIPEEKALSISFQVDLIVNGVTIETYTHSERILPSVAFQNGYSYNFVAELNPENINPEQELYPILFMVESIDEWKDDTETKVTL